MLRDIFIVVALDAVMALLTGAYLWLINRVWTGMASIHVALWWALMGIICTMIAGALVHRLYVGILGILAFWTIMLLFDWWTTSATFLSVTRAVAILAVVQTGVMGVAWWFGFQMRRYTRVDQESGAEEKSEREKRGNK
jgi:hypothetical protein